MSDGIKYLALIQARIGSSRLPNKVMLDLCGKTVLQRIVDRVRKSAYVDEVIVVTSIQRENMKIVKLCADHDIRVGVGSEQDVLDRFYQIAKLFRPQYVIRLTADCPCFDAELLDNALENMDDEVDYCAAISETIADGLDFEIISFDALEEAWKMSDMPHQREHVTPYITEHPDRFRLQDYVSPFGDFGKERWTIDEQEDYELIKRIYAYFEEHGEAEDFGYRDILTFLDDHPHLRTLNQMYHRNEGYEKSLKEEGLL